MSMNIRLEPSRRDLLKGTGALVIAFSVAPSSDAFAQALPPAKSVALDQVDTFLAIDSKGMVTVYIGKVDLGTGVRIAFAQIAAEELDVPLANVSVIEGDTALTPDQGPTYGSLSIQNAGPPLRQAAATARKALLDNAAKQLDAEPADLVVRDGVVGQKAGGKTVTYGELIGGKNFMLKVDPAAPPKNPADYKLVGKPTPRRDIAGKVTGDYPYIHNFRIDSMLYGSVIRPPALAPNSKASTKPRSRTFPALSKSSATAISSAFSRTMNGPPSARRAN
jgi:nicotinate dehydrogenase subunit B